MGEWYMHFLHTQSAFKCIEDIHMCYFYSTKYPTVYDRFRWSAWWFGHVPRRDSGDIGRRMLDMELPGRRQRGRPKRRYKDAVKEDMQVVSVRVEDTKNRVKWKTVIPCGDPWKKERCKKKKKGWGWWRQLPEEKKNDCPGFDGSTGMFAAHFLTLVMSKSWMVSWLFCASWSLIRWPLGHLLTLGVWQVGPSKCRRWGRGRRAVDRDHVPVGHQRWQTACWVWSPAASCLSGLRYYRRIVSGAARGSK